MTQEVARHLFEEGAFLVFLDVPKGTEFGIDLNSWHVGPRFRGVKMIPPGIHFVFYSAVSKEGQTAPRTGFFYNFKSREIVIKKWDEYLEDIKDEPLNAAEVERLQANIHDMDGYLGAYPYDSLKMWWALVNQVTESVLNRLQPLNKKISSASELVLDPSKVCSSGSNGSDDPPSTKRQKPLTEDDFLPKMCLKPGTEIRFTKFPEQRYPDGSTAAEITQHSLDLSYTFQQVVQSYENPEDILGDLQIAFVCFVIGQVFDAFEQWKKLVHLLCSCEQAMLDYPSLFSKLIFTLHYQLQEIPRDFFVDIVTRQNFLTTTLHSFFSNLNSNPNMDKDLVAKGKRFQKHLTKKFKWDFETEPDEYAPVVVKTNC